MPSAETGNRGEESEPDGALSGDSLITPIADFVLLFLVTLLGGLWLAMYL